MRKLPEGLDGRDSKPYLVAMTNTEAPVVTSALIHYGFPRVWVEPYRTTDNHGNAVEVHDFYRNGGLISCEGFRVKQDGTTYTRKSVLGVSAPANIVTVLEMLED